MKEYRYKYQEQHEQQAQTEWDNEMFNDFMSDEEEDSKYYDPYDDPSYRLLYGGHMSNETGMLIGAVFLGFVIGVPMLIILILGLL